jgi:hypothetical protein
VRVLLLHGRGRARVFARLCNLKFSCRALQIFNVDALDLTKVAKSFGFAVAPNVNLGVHSSKEGQIRARGGGGGFGTGYRDASAKSKMFRKQPRADGRQFSH